MATCCGGKNAGKPISWLRYLAGVGVFFSYHGTVAAALHLGALANPGLRHVRDFHRELFLTEGLEVLRRHNINVNGPEPAPKVCEVPARPEARSNPAWDVA